MSASAAAVPSTTAAAAAAAAAAAEADEKRKDAQRMIAAVVRLLGVPIGDATGASPSNPIANALKREGILLFYDDFVCLTSEHIENLHWDNGGSIEPLIMRDKLHLRSLLAFFHYIRSEHFG